MNDTPPLGPWRVFVALTSLLPLVGLPSALYSIWTGIHRFKRRGWALVLLGLLGLAGSYGASRALFRDTAFSRNAERNARILRARGEMRVLVKRIEDYRSQTGRLPYTLEEVSEGLPSADRVADQPLPGNPLPYFYESLSDQPGYYLFSRGPDGSAFTSDDVYPLLNGEEKAASGFRAPPTTHNILQAAPSGEDPGRILWREPEEGLAEARKTGKPVLMDFTAEWCGWCHKLERDVFDQPEVTKFINQHYVPIRVMDRRSETGSNTKIVSELQEKFGLRGFPMLVVADADLKRSSKQNGYVPLEGSFAFLKAFVNP